MLVPLLELVFALALVPLAVMATRRRAPVGERFWRWLRPWTSRPWVGPAFVGVVALLVQVLFALVVGLPSPRVHDEFAYLLGADTFAHGRLTNPTHPLWEHFESFHVIHQPSYQMKFPPGQSLVMALGQWLGNPVIGVWLGIATGCAAVAWMLRGWVPPRWAAYGGLWIALNFRLTLDWGQTYWGGGLAMLGGALLLGAMPRLLRNPSFLPATAFAVGLAILAITRPYEGLLVGLPTGLVLLTRWWKQGLLSAQSLWRVALPMLGVLVPMVVWSLYYNFRVTGDPLCLPYQVWQRTYAPSVSIAQTLLGREREVSNDARRVIPMPEVDEATSRQRRAEAPPELSPFFKLGSQWWFYCGFLGTLPLLASLTLRSWKTAYAIGMWGVLLGAILLMSAPARPHYSAPLACASVLLVVMGWRRIAAIRWRGDRLGLSFIHGTGLAAVVLLAGAACEAREHFRGPVGHYRPQVINELRSKGQRHLILVRYRPNHDYHQEWVYNEASIDDAQVIWARELSPERNQKLFEYFADRRIWVLDADAEPPSLHLLGNRQAASPGQETSNARPRENVNPAPQ